MTQLPLFPPPPRPRWEALLEHAAALRRARDGTPLSALGISPRVARRVVWMLADGLLYSGPRSQECRPVRLRLQRDGGDLVVRRVR